MSRFGTDPRAFFEPVHRAPAPWDIGAPQPAGVGFVEESIARAHARSDALPPGTCDRFVADLARAIRPGGRLCLHEFAVEFPVPTVPRQVTTAEVRERASPARGWRILALRLGEFLSRVDPVPATPACIERAMPGAPR